MKKQSIPKKKPQAPIERPVVEQEKPSPKRKRMGGEIEEIFAGKKRKRPEEGKTNTKSSPKASRTSSNSHEKTNRVKGGKSGKTSNKLAFGNSTSGSRKKTADGLTIYTEEELGFGKADAGGTPLCPFDCDCCF